VTGVGLVAAPEIPALEVRVMVLAERAVASVVSIEGEVVRASGIPSARPWDKTALPGNPAGLAAEATASAHTGRMTATCAVPGGMKVAAMVVSVALAASAVADRALGQAG
jgi:hypothetical protein